MMKKAENTLLQAFLRARLAIMQFEQEERGDAVQTIIVIGIGVLIAGLLYTFLTGNGVEADANGNYSDKGQGLIGKIFHTIQEKLPF